MPLIFVELKYDDGAVKSNTIEGVFERANFYHCEAYTIWFVFKTFTNTK